MSLEEFTPVESTWESGWWSNEKAREMSEKFKEQVKKASAWIKRTQKDEWKAKKQDMLLANFLVKIILNKKFDDVLELLFNLLDKGYPSNFLLWILSLIYIDISDKIREISGIEKINFNFRSEKTIDFDLSWDEVKDRITHWVEDIIMSTTADYSHLLTVRLIELLEKQEDDIIIFTSNIFIFFLKEINIKISSDQAQKYSIYILWEVLKKIKSLDVDKI